MLAVELIGISPSFGVGCERLSSSGTNCQFVQTLFFRRFTFSGDFEVAKHVNGQMRSMDTGSHRLGNRTDRPLV